MNTEPLACPYCNAFVTTAAGMAVGQRIPCPRCGEAFTLRQPPPRGSAALQEAPSGALSVPVGVQLDVERGLGMRRTNRIVAAGILGVMGLMAAVGLSYALYTQADRRANDTRMPHKPRGQNLPDLPPAPATTPPAALEALRWLPADSTLVAGVQVAELRQTDAGRELLHHLFRVGKVDVNADLLERWTGLKTDDIDHLVLGVRADDGVPPCTVLVVRTLGPYDVEAVKKALRAEPAPGAAGKTLYRCKPVDGGLRPLLWCADEQTLVFGLLEKHLDDIPDRPAAGLERLPPEVRMLLEERLDAAGPAWAVGHAADWRKTGAALLLGAMQEKDISLLGHVHDFAFQLQAERPAKLLTQVCCDDADGAKVLEARLLAAKPGPDADWKAVSEGPWLMLQIRGEPGAAFTDLGK